MTIRSILGNAMMTGLAATLVWTAAANTGCAVAPESVDESAAPIITYDDVAGVFSNDIYRQIDNSFNTLKYIELGRISPSTQVNLTVTRTAAGTGLSVSLQFSPDAVTWTTTRSR
jgi:hypothetical protein